MTWIKAVGFRPLQDSSCLTYTTVLIARGIWLFPWPSKAAPCEPAPGLLSGLVSALINTKKHSKMGCTHCCLLWATKWHWKRVLMPLRHSEWSAKYAPSILLEVLDDFCLQTQRYLSAMHITRAGGKETVCYSFLSQYFALFFSIWFTVNIKPGTNGKLLQRFKSSLQNLFLLSDILWMYFSKQTMCHTFTVCLLGI